LKTKLHSLNSRYREGRSAYLLLSPYIVMFSMFIAIPIIIAVGLSFTYYDMIQTPRPIGFLNYIVLLTQDEVFLKNVIPNTFIYALIVGPGGYVLSFLLAWMLSQIQKVPRTILALLIYMPSMAGGVFVSIVWKSLFSGNERGLINAFLLQHKFILQPIQFLLNPESLMPIMVFVALWSSMGVGFLAMLAGVLNYNEEIYEAAYVDGIRNRFQEIIYITIPGMKPQMLFGAVMAIVNAFNTGRIGVDLTGMNPTPQYAGQLILNHIEDYGFTRYEMGYAAAISVLLLAMVWGFSKVAYTLFAEKD